MPPQPQQPPTLTERYAFAQWLMQFPALTVMVFLRRDLGFRLLNPLRLLAVTGFLVVVSAFAQQGNANANPMVLLIFALAFFVLGIVQWIKSWFRLNRGVRQHSYYIGTSLYEFRRLPEFIHRNRRFSRFIDPLLCMLAGLVFYPISHAMTAWLFLSALSLRIIEYAVHQKYRDMDLDTIDGMIMAERQGQTVEYFENAEGTAQRPQSPDIPTGLGQDVEEHMKNRNNKQ
jgi:hypothetical protein